MVTPASLIAARPEFASVLASAPARVQAAIDDATAQVDDEVWGDQTDIGISLLAAHLIAISPNGMPARLVTKNGRTTYLDLYEGMRDRAGAAWRIQP